jgi:hypothetical protein
MEIANLTVVKIGQTTKDRVRASIETYNARPDKRIRPISVCDALYLDVDAILLRSLPKVSQPAVLNGVCKRTPS